MTQAQANTSQWKGSASTYHMVAKEIAKRWGEDAAKEYDPRKNCFTFMGWKARGYQVKRGEHGIRSITFIREQEVNLETKELVTVKSYPKTVVLFFKAQVQQVKRGK